MKTALILTLLSTTARTDRFDYISPWACGMYSKPISFDAELIKCEHKQTKQISWSKR